MFARKGIKSISELKRSVPTIVQSNALRRQPLEAGHQYDPMMNMRAEAGTHIISLFLFDVDSRREISSVLEARGSKS